MGSLGAKAVYCPKEEDHPKKKLLLLLHEDGFYVHCKDHGWIKIKLSKLGEPVNLEDVAVQVESIHPKTHFDLEPVPVVAIGEFCSKRG